MRASVFLSLWCGVLGACCALGEEKAATPSARSAKQAAPGEVRDVIVLLDHGPLHLRLRVSLGGKALQDVRSEYIDRLMQSLDADGDGKLTSAEAQRSPLIESRQRASANEFLQSLAGKKIMSRREMEQTVERKGGETVVYRQDSSSSDNDVEVFKFLDANGDGLLDADEMLAARNKILAKDDDRDECVSFREFLPQPEPMPMQLVVQLPNTPQPRPQATVSDMIRDANEPLLPRRMLRKYDRDRDARLDAAELSWSAERVRALDKNRDKRLDDRELAAVSKTPVDLELAIDLDPSGSEQPAIRVLAAAGERTDGGQRPDFAKVNFGGAAVTFSHRQVDPVAAAVENAMREFNRMDVDGNGYLDRMETSPRIRFERYLFDQIDADGDDKIFGDEMKQYVTVRAEPEATSCQVNVYDLGRGFFMALDRNGDGRISVREMRTADDSLRQMKRNGDGALAANEPTRHFHIEFVRRSFQLFGRADDMIAQSPAFEERAAVGPIWFQRMDRNNDGDLTWNEFLGPREVFHRLDADNDALISPQEAEEAGAT